MQALKLLTDLQRKFLVQMNSYHRSRANDRDGKYKMRYIVNLRIDRKSQSLIVTFKNLEVFSYSGTGAIIKIK